MEQWLENLCKRITDLFFRCFGDPNDSQSGDVVLPVDALSNWQPVVVMNNPSILVLKNSDAANELMFTFNKDMPIGFRIAAGDTILLDNVSGLFYAKSSDATLASALNYAVISLKVH